MGGAEIGVQLREWPNRGANAFYLFLLRCDVDLEQLLPDFSETQRGLDVVLYLRFSWRRNRGLQTHSSSLHTPTSKDDRGEYRQRQSIL